MCINAFEHTSEQYRFFWILWDYKQQLEEFPDVPKHLIERKYLKLLEQFDHVC